MTKSDHLQAYREKLAAGEITRGERKDPIQKLATNPKSLRLSVNAKCYDCEGGDADPGVRARIGGCKVTTCGLWAVRPYQKGDSDE
jgi:hypothetical protein